MIALSLTLCAPAYAQAYDSDPESEDFDAYSPYYTGAFLGGGVFVGESLSHIGEDKAGRGESFGGWLQFSLPLQILDLQLSGIHSSETLAYGKQSLDISQSSLSLGAGFHPFFTFHLENSVPYYILAGSYGLLAVDVEWIKGGGDSDAQVGYVLGWGIDAPLDDVDDGGSFWIGVQYRYNQWSQGAPLAGVDASQHVLYLRLGYRNNGYLTSLL